MAHKKPKLTNILFILLFLGGLAVMFYPQMSDLWMRYTMSRELEKYEQVIKSDNSAEEELFAAAAAYNRELAQKRDQFKLGPGELERIRSLLNPLGNNMMGTVIIPKINEELPIYQGIEEKQLQSGAGWIYGTSLPIGGESTHAVITAHNGLVKAKLFTDLDKLAIGDRFYLKILSRRLVYTVDQILVVKPEDFSELTIIPDEDHVTLYTCTPYGVNTHRLLVRGVRTEEALPPSDPATEAIHYRHLLHFLIMETILLALLIAWIFIFVIFYKKTETISKPHKKRKQRQAVSQEKAHEQSEEDKKDISTH